MSGFDIVTPPTGVVSLNDKKCPVFESSTVFHDHYAYTRGFVDVSAFKAKLRSMPAEIWDDENQEGNVRITRASHDAWGIKKIVFNFCDDFLLKVLDLPWSQLPEWKSLLHSVYAAIGIDESRVVRSLLASMPSGVNIPVHHDTGYWVKHTHRCHLAIETGDEVEFRVGPTSDRMQQYKFDEGRIVELNNQAKHSVVNNLPNNKHRVHLIFDYVDEHPISQRYLLTPGEQIYQTRRSIDVARTQHTDATNGCNNSANNKRNSPGFIIIGAQKCGTTSMYELICQHPLVARGSRRETHYFDWRYATTTTTAVSSTGNNNASAASGLTKNTRIEEEDYDTHYAQYMRYFPAAALQKHTSMMTGESTPSYLFHSDLVIPRMKGIAPLARVLVMLRDPTDRAYSQYQMCIDRTGTPEQLLVRGESTYRDRSFLDVISEEIAELQSLGITATSSYQEFRDKFLITRRNLTHGGHSIIARGLYALQLAGWQQQWPAEQLHVCFLSELNNHNKEELQATMDRVFGFIQLPPHDIISTTTADNKNSDVESKLKKNSRDYAPMTKDCKAKLDEFYAPFNARLFELLGKTESKW